MLYRALGLLHPDVDLNGLIQDSLTNALPPNAHKLASGRLRISVTRIDGKNEILSQFDSNDDLIQAIKCSCFIPIYSGLLYVPLNGG